MTSTPRKKSHILALVRTTIVLALAACHIEATAEIRSTGETKVVIVFEDNDDMMRRIHRDCTNLENYLPGGGKFVKNAKIEDITQPGGHLKCRSTSYARLDKESEFIEKKDVYIFNLSPSKAGKQPTELLETTTVISMPGKILKSSAGRVEGNKVVLEGLDFLGTGLSVTSEKKSGVTGSTLSPTAKAASSEKATSSASAAKSDGVPPWAWALIGVGSLAAIAGVTAAAVRRRRQSPSAP